MSVVPRSYHQRNDCKDSEVFIDPDDSPCLTMTSPPVWGDGRHTTRVANIPGTFSELRGVIDVDRSGYDEQTLDETGT